MGDPGEEENRGGRGRDACCCVVCRGWQRYGCGEARGVASGDVWRVLECVLSWDVCWTCERVCRWVWGTPERKRIAGGEGEMRVVVWFVVDGSDMVVEKRVAWRVAMFGACWSVC